MFSHELALAQAHRTRRRSSSAARKRALTEGAMRHSIGGTGRRSFLGGSATGSHSFSGRKSAGDLTAEAEAAEVPLAVSYLEQVTMELSVTKKHADVRYVMTVRHAELNVAWRHARSFDEYRKLQQRLLKKLQHGHFCGADCPWLYGFLKSYFPKRLVFQFSSARVVEARKLTLERFFAALLGFLMDRKNHCCAIVMHDVADALVDFIYGDALQQYGLENPAKSSDATASQSPMPQDGANSLWGSAQTPQKPPSLPLSSGSGSFLSSSMANGNENDFTAANDPSAGDCLLCGCTLSGEANSGVSSASTSTSSFTLGNAVPTEEQKDASMTSVLSGGQLSSDSSSVDSNSGRGAFQPPWLGRITSNGSGSGRRSGSGTRLRRAATYYMTTLSCGHRFHDECIVPKLNESMCCPTCGRVQKND